MRQGILWLESIQNANHATKDRSGNVAQTVVVFQFEQYSHYKVRHQIMTHYKQLAIISTLMSEAYDGHRDLPTMFWNFLT